MSNDHDDIIEHLKAQAAALGRMHVYLEETDHLSDRAPDDVDPPYDRDRHLPPYEESSTSVERE